ncbi:EIN3-binding F-box protein 1-like [Impatiens glandulifera]|uniref:EIN3-binding F-box protein 1-like n=1 Tax=Impatiens glandulifera TaxID=253017 RepID=UPI001FB08AA2|nr:EIN3-binding F-box protein 1-like [Impatiens glandulifera]
MAKLFDYLGDDLFNHREGKKIYQNTKESDRRFLSINHGDDIYFPPSKRSRVNAPFVFTRNTATSIDVLPDECLFEIFKRLNGGGQERSSVACVSKRWLNLLGSIRREDDICNMEISLDSDELIDGFLSRSLEGNKATDTRLTAIAVGTSSRGGLGKLSIRGNNSLRGVTNLGFKAVANNCPSLRVLSLWKLSSIDDESLIDIANGCPQLEKLDLSQCPAITDKGLIAVAKRCPGLSSLIIESCPKIGSPSLQAVGSYCPNLKSLTIKNCPLVDDKGIVSLMSSVGFSLSKLKLEALNVGDYSLAVIGHYGKALTELSIFSLKNTTGKGFWVMGNVQGLQKLRSFFISSCNGVTDVGLEAIGKGCPSLKQFNVSKCCIFSDEGLLMFAKSAMLLESLRLEECHRITQRGVVDLLSRFGRNLKGLALVNCMGLKDEFPITKMNSSSTSLRSLIVDNCPGFGDEILAAIGQMCPQLNRIDLSRLQGITDLGITQLVSANESGIVKMTLRNCLNLTDKVICLVADSHGSTLEQLNLDGCKGLTDASLIAIARDCSMLTELDVSRLGITDLGVAALASGLQFNLQILSVAGCSKVTDKSFPRLIELGESGLMGLDIRHCNGISSGTVDQLLDQLCGCDILY